jgi:betaine-aldehyde dehydrogenase
MATTTSAASNAKTYKNFVNNQWVAAASGETFAVYDPSTEEVIANVAAAGKSDVDAAVKAAREAFDNGPWRQTTAQDRGRILFKLAEKIRENSAALADLECRNSGKPIVEAEYDIADVATCFEYYGGLATKVTGHVNPVPANALSFTMREPVGVAAQIIPWNYPLLMAAWKLAPAIAAGCCCVLKPAEQTPLTALEFAHYFEEVGLPPGVINIINGLGETAGAALVAHPGVDKVAFTGSDDRKSEAHQARSAARARNEDGAARQQTAIRSRRVLPRPRKERGKSCDRRQQAERIR